MSPSFWRKWLRITLERADALRTRPCKVACLGIGNEFNGDDAAGLWVVRGLIGRLSARGRNPSWWGAEAGLAPENFTGALRRFQPDVVLMVDAAEMGRPPGSIAWLDWRQAQGFGPSTHLQPLATLAEYMERELSCEVGLLGVQPATLDFDVPLSVPVEAAVRRLVGVLVREANRRL